MDTRIRFLFLVTSLLFAACSAPAANTTEATPMPVVVADETIVAEGRIEPVNYAAVAYNASGVISDVLVKEGDK